MTLDEQVAQDILDLGKLSLGLNSYNDADPTTRAGIMNTAAHIIGGRQHYTDALRNLEKGDGAYAVKVRDSIKTRAELMEEAYNANKATIVDDVASRINAGLAEAKAEAAERGYEFGEPDAIKTVARILGPLLGIRKPTEGYARHLKAVDLAQTFKMNPRVITDVVTDVKEGQDILTRMAIAEAGYVTARENGYSVNSEALSELMNEPETGAMLYAATRPKER